MRSLPSIVLASALALHAAPSALAHATSALGAQDESLALPKALKSKDANVRLAAIRTLIDGRELEGAEREKLLIKTLGDDDWEIVELSATALGAAGATKAFDELVELALEGPVRRLRRVAAEALAGIDAEGAWEAFAKKASGKLAVPACEALGGLARTLDGAVSLAPLEKALGHGEAEARAAAARALVLLGGKQRAALLARILAEGDVRVQCAAVEAAGASEDPDCLAPLRDALARPQLVDVLERRIYGAQRAIFLAHASDVETLWAPYVDASGLTPSLQVRVARLLGRLGEEHNGARALEPERVLWHLEPALGHDNVGIRHAATGALRRVGTGEALDRAQTLATSDPAEAVRLAALDALVRVAGKADERTQAVALARAGADESWRMRELAAVALGIADNERGAEALVGLLRDPEVGVAIVAAVSLGLTKTDTGLTALVQLAASERWELRGAAVVGLSHVRRKAAVPVVIEALADDEPLVRRSAREFLRTLSPVDFEKQAEWRAWWSENEHRVQMEIPAAVLARRREFGYVQDTSRLYEGLDVVVLEDIGDHIETVLGFLGIEHRMTRGGQVTDAALHPDAVFVANCPAEINQSDVERLSWFVRVGGYLMGSCWALQETIARAYPGMVRRLPTSGEVLDEVVASPCVEGSPYLEGVFPPDCRPIYTLEGAFLIQVLDPERVEVLVDSPACAARWGGGNLVAWFPAGHGVVLDSANHFDLQGLARARGLKKPEERKAWAVDHMGLGLERLRELSDEKFWKKNPSAAANVKDLSVFRLVTNFVRRKRSQAAE